MGRLHIKDRFWMKVVKSDDPAGCWIWTAAKQPRGYGLFAYKGVVKLAHRISYEWEYGPIPDGKEIDHLCKNTSCVYPQHLRAVTHRENVLAPNGRGWAFNHATATHCPKGHPYNAANTLAKSSGRRGCRECDNARHRKANSTPEQWNRENARKLASYYKHKSGPR